MTPVPTYVRHAVCKRIIDGETYDMDVKGSFGHHAEVHLRLRGIDTPEQSTPEGQEATRFVTALLQPNGVPAPLVVETFKTRTGTDLRTLSRKENRERFRPLLPPRRGRAVPRRFQPETKPHRPRPGAVRLRRRSRCGVAAAPHHDHVMSGSAVSGLRRATGLGPPEMLLLQGWGTALFHAFDEMPYLVGSVVREEAWRDVDVRMMLTAEGIAGLTSGRASQLAALNLSVSLWGQRATGLPVDFQFQEIAAANVEHGGPRNPIGWMP